MGSSPRNGAPRIRSPKVGFGTGLQVSGRTTREIVIMNEFGVTLKGMQDGYDVTPTAN
ncbi:DNA-directed RNA polymerase, beta subunit [Alicyclobacillus hesperidum URH17-3-68]|nr:DNA-directed RNA polymerase, beta subunit [Alicyclobacillus hesperidum URH17-3-68]